MLLGQGLTAPGWADKGELCRGYLWGPPTGEAGQAIKVYYCTKGPDKAFQRTWGIFMSGDIQELTGEGPDQPYLSLKMALL